uniref:interleukin-17C-like isoform X2 n=1 Tax=Monopterus albus TaxID=43700 RepID=UPI0009B4C066|nr:interleukin-17C-like isoform X2 [Monopterus albus]
MTWISLWLLLIFNDQKYALPTTPRTPRCVTADELNHRINHFRRNQVPRIVSEIPVQDTRTCAQVDNNDKSHRSLSPWKYSLDRDVNRFPEVIALAECLCQGCIIDQYEDLTYNSVLVFSHLMVLRKTLCPHDPNKYVVKKDLMKVPVACTCVVPKSNR